MISCLGVPFSGYSVFSWLQFYKSEFIGLNNKYNYLIFNFFLYLFFNKINPVKDCRFEIARNGYYQFLLRIDINNISAIANSRIDPFIFINNPP